MFCRRRSVSKMAEAAAAAAREHCPDVHGIATLNVAVAAAVAVHSTTPDRAPAQAAEAAAQANASGAVCTAIAAGVAAASEGLRLATCLKAASAAFDAFSAYQHIPIIVQDLDDEVAGNVYNASSVYPAVEAAAAAAYAAYLPNPPEGDAIVNDAAVVAVNAALAAARASEGSESSSYRETAATRAATFRGTGRRLLLSVVVKAALSTCGFPTTERSSFAAAVKAALPTYVCPFTHPACVVPAVIADASASFGSKAASSVGVRGVEQLEALSDDHKRTYDALQMIMALDTFLAGFLLNSLTGAPEGRELTDAEETIILVETAAFGVLLGATMAAAMLLLVTGGTRTLSRWALIFPGVLSMAGVTLAILAVAFSSANALGVLTDDASDVDASLLGSFLCVILLGLLAPVYPAFWTLIWMIHSRVMGIVRSHIIFARQ